MAKLRVDKIAAPIVKDEFTGSVFFDGTGDYLEFAQNTDLSFGTGDYTVECWIYPQAVSGNLEIVLNTGGSNNNTFYLHYDENQLSVGNQSTFISNQATTFENFTWYHIAACRQNGVLKLFRNGVQVGSNATDTTDWAAGGSIRIGLNSSGSQGVNGYISNLRVCKGHAVYFSNFTPPTRELEVHIGAKGIVFPAADNRTVLLACQSSTDATADATGRHTITANRNAHAQSANPGLLRRTLNLTTVTENTGSVFFDGTGDRLDIAHSTDFRIADSNTFECWINYNSLPTNNLFLGVESSYWIGYNHTTVGGASNKFVFTIYNGSSWQAVSSSTTPVVGTWYHLAAIKDGTSLKMFVNGVLENTTAMSGTAAAVTDFFNIGKWDQAASEQGVNGYLSNVRVCKGHAVYKSNFIPPTTELEVHPGPDDDRTVLLCCYDGENIFADKTGRHIIAAAGDRLSSPTPTATDSPIGITTFNPGLTRNVDPTAGPTFQGGAGFTSQNWLTLPKGTTTERMPKLSNAISHGSARAIFGAIQVHPTAGDSIHYSTIATFGNTIDFGDLNESRKYAAGCSSKTRGLFGGGSETSPGPAIRDSIDYITIASTGNALDFGNLTQARWGLSAFSNSTRGIFFSGNTSPTNVNTIDYVTISTLGNALDFGDALSTYRYVGGSTSDSTRGISAGGYSDSGRVNIIQYVTMASTGNAQDFGDLLAVVQAGCGGVSNGTRGVFAGGYTPTQVNTIEYITIQSMGNSNDFGDMTSTTAQHGAAAESSIRGLFTHGGYPSRLNTIDAITIATTGNAVEFGDIIDIGGNVGGGDSGTQSGFSNGHGGLG